MKNIVYISIVVFLLLINGCGYKPSSYYAQNSITGKVYVNLSIDIKNGQNETLIKDAMIEMIINRFHSTITNDKSIADTIVNVALSSISYSAIQSDNEGYVKSYRTTVKIQLSYHKKDKPIESFVVSDYYDFAITADSSITESKKQDSIKIAATKALSNIFSKIAIKSMKDDSL